MFNKVLIKEYNQKYPNKIQLNTAAEVYSEMHDIKQNDREFLVVFHLNTKNQIIAREIVSIGILNASLIHPREVFKHAICFSANAIILSHNHPSGDPTPSSEDIRVTKTLRDVGSLIGIDLTDHVIVCENDYYSLRMHNHDIF